MKMRTTFSLLIALFLVSIINITTSDAQDSAVYMYWTVHHPGKIQRANLDGSNVQDIVTGLAYPEEIAVDIAGDKMYWTDRDTDKIQRANLNGTDVEDLVTTGSPATGGTPLRCDQ